MIISKVIDVIARAPTHEEDKIKTSRFRYIGKPIFKGEIEDRQEKYNRGKDHVIFKAKYQGKIEHGYFAAEIIPPSSFSSDTFHLDMANGNVTSFCETTVNENIEKEWNIHNIPSNLGKINGRNVKTKWFDWTWTIPQYAPKGDYRVIIGVWSASNKDENKDIPIQFSERSFYVIGSNDSSYQPRVQFLD